MKASNSVLMSAIAQPITTKNGNPGYIVNGEIVVGTEIISVSFFAQPNVVETMNQKVCLVDYDSSEQYPTKFKGFALDTKKSYAI